MSSDTPVRIDSALVKLLVESQFPVWADLPVTPVALSGWDNRTFHLGERMIVRLPSGRHYAAAVAPRSGQHSFRGGSLKIWDRQARSALAVLGDKIDTDRATAIWDAALNAPFTDEPVWYHGDIAAGNLLVRDGRLCAVIDFGGLAVGDPACDLAIAWTLLDATSRAAFRARLDVSDAIWARGRGWVLWKGMIILANLIETNVIEAASAEHAVEAVLGSMS
ncbi:MAG: phosphotransferase [Proteobacteria bacterium]|nr:phosphotransferase [Pseudomonadota bacterium]